MDKFLGLNEAVDGTTELKLGEASKIENFTITDDYNLKSRPGVRIADRSRSQYLAVWQGYIGTRSMRLIVYKDEDSGDVFAKAGELDGEYQFSTQLLCDPSMPIKIFTLGSRLYIYGTGDEKNRARMEAVLVLSCDEDGQITNLHGEDAFYRPVIITGCAPSGGGTELEQMNILTKYVRVRFSSDGNSTAYTLPPVVGTVKAVTVDGSEQALTQPTGEPLQYQFKTAPAKGENNVEFLCVVKDDEHTQACEKFLRMRHCEYYNRLFFYGDDTNICYYTEEPAFGDGLYLPAGYELAVDSSAGAITGMRLQNSRLLAFKPDGTFSIDYQPITLADNRVIAGFYVYPVHRGIGNEMDNQVQTVGNYARTLCGGSLYEWRNSASYHQDERYAKRISEKVNKTLAAADPKQIVTCDDNATQTYYMFLNDEEGTVLVNRYAIDVWTIYKGEAFKGVLFATASQGDVLFAVKDTVYRLDGTMTFDDPVEEGGESLPIDYAWESGYMSFGADYKRKYSSNIWVSMLPETASQMEITVKTDRRDEYLAKTHALPLFDFVSMDFSNFSFLTSSAPKIKRIKIKVKKFVYYKLIFRSKKPGTRATILGYDQPVRYSSNVK